MHTTFDWYTMMMEHSKSLDWNNFLHKCNSYIENLLHVQPRATIAPSDALTILVNITESREIEHNPNSIDKDSPQTKQSK
jgi:hypothetical protein